MSHTSDYKPDRLNFLGDKRISRVHVYPKSQADYSWLSPQSIATASSHGRSCSSCMLNDDKECSHSVNNGPRVLILGDEFCPILAGSGGECATVLRIESGDFDQMERFVNHQISAGLKIEKGSVAVVCMLSHLRRSGVEDYWSDLMIFSQRLKKLNLTVIPAVPCFPEGLEYREICHILQFYKRCQYEHFGRSDVGTQKNFSLWKILSPLAVTHESRSVVVSAPHVRVAEAAGRKLIDCQETFTPGFPGNWSDGMPKGHFNKKLRT